MGCKTHIDDFVQDYTAPSLQLLQSYVMLKSETWYSISVEISAWTGLQKIIEDELYNLYNWMLYPFELLAQYSCFLCPLTVPFSVIQHSDSMVADGTKQLTEPMLTYHL